ncbi:MAG: DNA polymerase III subunit delta' [Rhodospirillaceae bacterium]|nr:DNA polymerase III subunit delta' [Rhodospirillaceae bacterium]|tara:strand:- start:407 stop:1507 length:1101 start_codon:yes stop_codon:yes gene_type:complete
MSGEPSKTPDLIGHETAEKHFLESWNSGRLPHAWLISGEEGSGKATLAFRIARFVLFQGNENSKRQEKGDLFGKSIRPKSLYIAPDNPIFRRVASEGHTDLKILKRTINSSNGKIRNSIAVEDVRLCGNFLRLTSAEAGWRVLIIDSVDELTISAANALLKILEEPPNDALILIVCHNPYLILPTIKSRCCQLSLKPLESERIRSFLSTTLPNINPSDIEALTILSNGSPGRALKIIEEEGLILLKELVMLISNFPKISTADLHDFGEKLAKNGAENKFKLTMNLFNSWLAYLIKEAASNTQKPKPMFPEESGCGIRIVRAAGVEFLIQLWKDINLVSEKTLRQNLDRKQAFLTMLYHLNDPAFDK